MHFAQSVIKILPFPGDLDPLGPKSIIILLFGIFSPLAPTGPVLVRELKIAKTGILRFLIELLKEMS